MFPADRRMLNVITDMGHNQPPPRASEPSGPLFSPLAKKVGEAACPISPFRPG